MRHPGQRRHQLHPGHDRLAELHLVGGHAMSLRVTTLISGELTGYFREEHEELDRWAGALATLEEESVRLLAGSDE